jgi:hypothetical protein
MDQQAGSHHRKLNIALALGKGAGLDGLFDITHTGAPPFSVSYCI